MFTGSKYRVKPSRQKHYVYFIQSTIVTIVQIQNKIFYPVTLYRKRVINKSSSTLLIEQMCKVPKIQFDLNRWL